MPCAWLPINMGSCGINRGAMRWMCLQLQGTQAYRTHWMVCIRAVTIVVGRVHSWGVLGGHTRQVELV